MMSTQGVTLPSAWKAEQTETLGANVVRARALWGGHFQIFLCLLVLQSGRFLIQKVKPPHCDCLFWYFLFGGPDRFPVLTLVASTAWLEKLSSLDSRFPSDRKSSQAQAVLALNYQNCYVFPSCYLTAVTIFGIAFVPAYWFEEHVSQVLFPR